MSEAVRFHVDISSGKLAVRPGVNLLRFVEILTETEREICIVDLDAARGRSANSVVVDLIQRWPDRLIVAGGISDAEEAERLLRLGAARLVIGSAVQVEPSLACKLAGMPWDFAVDYSLTSVVRGAFDVRAKFQLSEALDLCATFPSEVGLCLTDAQAATKCIRASKDTAIDAKKLLSPRRVWFGGGINEIKEVRQLQAADIGSIVGTGMISDDGDLPESLLGHDLLQRLRIEL